MPSSTPDLTERLDDDIRLANSLKLISVKNDDHRKKLDEKRLDDSLKDRQHKRDQDAGETEIRKFTAETERMKLQFAEDGLKRANEESNQRQKQEHEKELVREKQEHEKELMRLKIEDSNNARQYELNLKREAQETIKLKLESDKKKEDLEKLKLQRLKLQYVDNRHARKHRERMASIEVDRLNAQEEIMRQRLDERRIATEENQGQLSELRDRCEQLEIQRRKEEEQDTSNLWNLGLAATGVGAASGAIGGVLGTTAAVGMAAGVAGAAAVLAPVSGTVAILSGAGYVYQRAMSSNRA